MSANANHHSVATKGNSLADVKLRPAHVATVRNESATASNPDADACGWVGSLHEAIDKNGFLRKESAADLGVNGSQLSRGEVHLNRLHKLPLTMQQQYLELVCARAGLRVRRADALDVILGEVRKQMGLLLDLVEAAKEQL